MFTFGTSFIYQNKQYLKYNTVDYNTTALVIKIDIIAKKYFSQIVVWEWLSCWLVIIYLSSFLSFGMAYDFIDCVGDDVDVVSDSEVCMTLNKNV